MQKRDARHKKKPSQSTDLPVVFSCEFLKKEELLRVLWSSAKNKKSA